MRQPKGQNFLIDTVIACRIVDSADLRATDTVLEIGPGKGILTNIILPRVKHMIVIEIDTFLADKLKQKYAGCSNIEVINKDFMDFDAGLLPSSTKIIANLPYNMATVIIENILPLHNWSYATLMVQKEVANRIVANKNSKQYGVLSLICQYYAASQKVLTCGPRCFMPRPKVDSTVLKLTNTYPPAPDKDLFYVIKAAFQQRRKTILNSLSNVLGCPKAEIQKALLASKIGPSLRPENLSLLAYGVLTLHLKRCIIKSTKR